jgi:hypothetical protein
MSVAAKWCMSGRYRTMDADKHVLCYVSGPWAYFTSRPLSQQWGDDWNDAPYEHNAERPYEPCWHNLPREVAKRGKLCTCQSCVKDWNIDGTPRWSIVKVAWDGPFATPDDGYANSPYSVEQINAGHAPWLRTSDDYRTPGVAIYAGAPLVDFIRMVQGAGGKVWREVESDE